MMQQSTGAMKLVNQSKNREVAQNVRVAQSFLARTKGLLGEVSLAPGHALWIQGSKFVACNSVHTFFMRFSIDAVFVDRNLVVKAVFQDLRPWRVTPIALGAKSVFELPAGTLAQSPVEIGDQLHVGH